MRKQAETSLRRNGGQVAGVKERLKTPGIDTTAAFKFVLHRAAGVIITDGFRFIDDAVAFADGVHGDAEFVVDDMSRQRVEDMAADGEHIAMNGDCAAAFTFPAADGSLIFPVK